jgi:hypothetical protein
MWCVNIGSLPAEVTATVMSDICGERWQQELVALGESPRQILSDGLAAEHSCVVPLLRAPYWSDIPIAMVSG